jgi:hypothetical protein
MRELVRKIAQVRETKARLVEEARKALDELRSHSHYTPSSPCAPRRNSRCIYVETQSPSRATSRTAASCSAETSTLMTHLASSPLNGSSAASRSEPSRVESTSISAFAADRTRAKGAVGSAQCGEGLRRLPRRARTAQRRRKLVSAHRRLQGAGRKRRCWPGTEGRSKRGRGPCHRPR